MSRGLTPSPYKEDDVEDEEEEDGYEHEKVTNLTHRAPEHTPAAATNFPSH